MPEEVHAFRPAVGSLGWEASEVGVKKLDAFRRNGHSTRKMAREKQKLRVEKKRTPGNCVEPRKIEFTIF